MHRRDVLRFLGLLLLGGSVTGRAAAGAPGIRKPGGKRTLIIGAGVSGLAAARALKRHGDEVIVLEARDRIGGRIWTSSRWEDLPVDLGATWIHGVRGNPLSQLADTLQAQRLETHYDRASLYNSHGDEIREDEASQLERLRRQLLRALRRAQDRDPDISVQQAVASIYPGTPEQDSLMNFLLNGMLEHEYAGSIGQLSAHWHDSDEAFAGDDAYFVQGYKVITEFLARDIHVEPGQIVAQIDWRQSEVRVATQDREFVADRVLVTLPLGVLQSRAVRFLPELPEAKRDAIDKLGMGVLNKCCLRFPHAFWPHDVDWLEYISPRHGEWTQWVSLQHTARQPVLIGFNAADYGRQIELGSDQQVVESAMQTLRTVFGAGIPQPLDHQITRWATDPFSRGSYSFNALGSTPEMRDTLAAPLSGQLFFAGEATSRDYFGTVHGAYLSGLRVAEELMAS